MPGNTSVFQTLLCRPNGVPQLIDNAGDDEPDSESHYSLNVPRLMNVSTESVLDGFE
jgi:hypothetical protein